jgi:hypothetical protein
MQRKAITTHRIAGMRITLQCKFVILRIKATKNLVS